MDQKLFHLLSLLFSTVALAATIVINGLTNVPDPRAVGFRNSTKETSNTFHSQITPAPFAPIFLWVLIYSLQIVWIIYEWIFLIGWSNIINPVIISSYSLIFSGFGNSICNNTWIYLWGNMLPQYALPVVILLGMLLYLAAGFEAVFVNRNEFVLRSTRLCCGINLYILRVLILNIIVIYVTYVTIAISLNFIIVLEYFANLRDSSAGTLGLCILLLAVLMYSVLENTLLHCVTRPVVTAWPVVMFALSAIISRHWNLDNKNEATNSIFSVVLLVVVMILFFLKGIVICVCRSGCGGPMRSRSII